MSQYRSRYNKGAIALRYQNGKDDAPRVIGKGLGELADRIIKIAKENKIIIQDDPLLFDSLYKIEIGEEIPVKLYKIIAELLAYVYRINKLNPSAK